MRNSQVRAGSNGVADVDRPGWARRSRIAGLSRQSARRLFLSTGHDFRGGVIAYDGIGIAWRESRPDYQVVLSTNNLSISANHLAIVV